MNSSHVALVANVTALSILSVLSNSGCATIVQGTSQVVTFNSNPSGATVQLSNGMTYTTPSQIKLDRDKDYIATITKDGYQSQVIPITSVLSGWLAGNLLLGGIIGGAVDMATGAAWVLSPENVTLNLQPLKAGETASAAPVTSMSVEDRLRAAERLHREGVLKDNEYEAIKKKLTDELKSTPSGG